MIFVTVGTLHFPFDRLTAALAGLPPDERLVVQHGSSAPGPAWSESTAFMPFETVADHVRAARVAVTHAGVGSIMLALSQGKRPLVVPRRAQFGEAVDDHQVALADRLEELGLVTAVDDPADLVAAVARVGDAATMPPPPSHPLGRELRAYVADAIAR